ncbi:hypothetical protein BGZ73_004070 [Actinomortierella ambigua]|nr:hypothetical protein BGZ73_004070 [Actinomortierella ambigua]
MTIKELAITIDDKHNGMRIWKIALVQWKTIVQSREQLRRSFKRGEITLNGIVAHETQTVSTGDKLLLRFNKRAAHESIYGREKLTVLLEDNELAIVLKPSGMTMMKFGFMLPYSLKSDSIADKEQQGIKPELSGRNSADSDDEEMLDLALSMAAADEGDDNGGRRRHLQSMADEDDFDKITNTDATLSKQRVPCAVHGTEKASNGLILVAKTHAMRQKLIQLQDSGGIKRLFRIICHGAFKKPTDDITQTADACSMYFQQNETIPIDYEAQDTSGFQQLRVVILTPSNTSGYVTTLDALVHSPAMGIHLRRYFMSIRHPVVGNSSNTRPLKANRDKGLCVALINVEFRHPSTGALVNISIEEPKKFEALREREEKAFNNRKRQDMEELQKGGLELAEEYNRQTEKPIAYLVGEKEFCGIRFNVTPATLIPRSSTETLVNATLALVEEQQTQGGIRILDVGTGSGCLLLTLLTKLDKSTGMGIDISPEALAVADINRGRHGMVQRASFAVGDLAKLEETPNVHQQFDFLVCNPPYLDSSKSARLTKSFEGTQYEPSVALFAEQSGYGAYELLAASLRRDVETLRALDDDTSPKPTIMAPTGHVVLEIGSGMGPRVREIFSFLRFVRAFKDQQSTERCLVFAISPNPL